MRQNMEKTPEHISLNIRVDVISNSNSKTFSKQYIKHPYIINNYKSIQQYYNGL